jgi:poly(hydroxyalkanoate) granule-associated protein
MQTDKHDVLEVVEENEASKDLKALSQDLVEKGREVWLAGLGALSSVGDEGTKLFNQLVSRGRELESEGRQRINALVDELSHRQQEVKERVEQSFSKLEDEVSGLVEKAMARLDVPSRSEIQELTAKVNQLAEQVEHLAGTLEKKA